MLRNLAADALGLSDLGRVVAPEDFPQCALPAYLLADERLHVLIQSRSDEYGFSNQAFWHLDGTSAISKRRLLKRFPYSQQAPHHILLETAGTLDLDAELKFTIGETNYSLDISRGQVDRLRPVYQALLALESACEQLRREGEVLAASFQRVPELFRIKTLDSELLLNLPDILNQTIAQLSAGQNARLREWHGRFEFSALFEKYLPPTSAAG